MTTLVWRKFSLPILIGLWLLGIAVGLRATLGYELTPGAAGTSPRTWPADSQLQRSTVLPTMVMMVHPRCPCSRASLVELGNLMAAVQKQTNVSVVFVRPEEFPDEWEKRDLWRAASIIPGVTVSVDPAGVEARRFGSETSGQVLLYGPEGQLLFSGGITSSRGHVGDNEGRASLQQLLTEGRGEKSETPVYGCPLFKDAAPNKSEELCDATHQ